MKKVVEQMLVLDCCDVCSATYRNDIDLKDELNILLSALSQLGYKDEVKIAEWIRRSNIAWTNTYDKTSFLYRNHNGRSMHFIKQYHIVGLVQLKLKSMIKGKGAYSVNGVYYWTEKRTHIINSTEPLLLPQENSSTNRHLQDNSNQSSCSSTENNNLKGKWLGEGCNILSVVRKLLSEPENWFKFEKRSYQFPGILPSASSQQLWYTKNVFNL